jgi:hypothetical protein
MMMSILLDWRVTITFAMCRADTAVCAMDMIGNRRAIAGFSD